MLGNGDGTFQAAVSYGSGTEDAVSVVVADVNGDGKPDLLVANYCANGNGDNQCTNTAGVVSVLLGNGDGTFKTNVNYSLDEQLPYSLVASSVAVADVNGDGKPDLLVANENNVAVLLGNGDGTFQTASTYSPGGDSVAAADVNGDGKPDIAVVNGNNVAVLLGNGDGTFQPAVSYSSGGEYADSVAIADVNGDGKPDIVVAECDISGNCGNGTVSVLLGNGDGTFQPAVSYSSGGENAESVAIADVNGDGKPDIVVANPCATSDCTSGSVGVLLGNGDGTFQAASITVTPELISPYVGALVLADFNGDGKLDVASGAGDFLLLGNGDGTFQPYLTLGATGSGIAVGDFNGDGKPDLAVGGVAVLLNITAGFHYATTAMLTSSANPANGGQPVTFTATVIPAFNAGAFTGDVTFYDGVNPLSTVPISNGQATLTTSALTSGNHSITAGYSGDSNYLSSVSPILMQTINTIPTTTTVSSSLNPSSHGQSVTFTATVTSQGTGTPTGTVTFTDGATILGLVSLTNGMAIQSISTLTTGTHSITASYSGDSSFASSSSSSLTQTVNRAASTTVVSAGVNPSTYAQSISLSATVTPLYGGSATGTVTFYDGTTTLGTVNLSGNIASLSGITLAAGSHAITATYSGDNNFLGSTSAPLTEIVNPATTATTLISTGNPVAPNQPVTYTATITSQYGGATTGTVSFKDGNATTLVSVTGANAVLTKTYSTTGTHSVTATYSGDSNNAGSISGTLKEYVEILPVASKTVVTTSGSPSFIDQAVTFTATITSTYGQIPDGETVTFYDGTAVLGTGTTASGMATFTTSALSGKSHTIKAAYIGDATFKSSSGTVTQVVQLYPSTTTVTSSPNPSAYGQSVTLTATVTSSAPIGPTGTVTFNDGSTTLGAATLSAGTATLVTTKLPVGSNAVTATYNGDTQNAKGTSAPFTQMVNQAVVSITLGSSPNPSTTGKSVKFTATLTSNGSLPNGQTVTFSYNGARLGAATITGGEATFSTTALPSGSDQVNATYAGSAEYSSASASVTQTVN